MMTLAFINPFDLLAKADPAGQIVFVLLCALSLLGWTTMLGKFFQLKRMRDNNGTYANSLANSRSVLDLASKPAPTNCPYAELTLSAISALDRAQAMAISPSSQIIHVENAIQRALDAVRIKYESKMILLGSIVSGAPFLGLLGTVWGVMIAFAGLATQNGPATIQALAPGVSSALLTTVAGLLVAIPAVFGYNFLLTRTKVMESELEGFASALTDRIELEYIPTNVPAAATSTTAEDLLHTANPVA